MGWPHLQYASKYSPIIAEENYKAIFRNIDEFSTTNWTRTSDKSLSKIQMLCEFLRVDIFRLSFVISSNLDRRRVDDNIIDSMLHENRAKSKA
jgi:hypothetical protein